MGVEILNNFHRVLSRHPGRKTITLIKVQRDRGNVAGKVPIFPNASDASASRRRLFRRRQTVFLLVVLTCFTASLGFTVSAGENMSGVQITMEIWEQ